MCLYSVFIIVISNHHAKGSVHPEIKIHIFPLNSNVIFNSNDCFGVSCQVL